MDETTERLYPLIRSEVLQRFYRADRLIEAHIGGTHAVDNLVTDIAKAFKDRLIAANFPEADDTELSTDPYFVLSIYKLLRNAMDTYIKGQIKTFGLDLTDDEKEFYFKCSL